jgi:hypothetical protein
MISRGSVAASILVVVAIIVIIVLMSQDEEVEFPLVNSQVPLVNSQVPLVNSQVPLVNSQVPLVNSQVPHVNSQVPHVNSQVPLIDFRRGMCANGQLEINGVCRPPYESVGCYKDKEDRALRIRLPGQSTIDSCAQYAKANNHKTFAMQAGSVCFVDTNPNRDYAMYGNVECSTRPNYPTGSGDGWLNEVYKWN